MHRTGQHVIRCTVHLQGAVLHVCIEVYEVSPDGRV